MFCENCGKPLEEGQMFCEECGHPVVPNSKEEKESKDKKENSKREKHSNKFKNYVLIGVTVLLCASLLAFGAIKILFPEESNTPDEIETEPVVSSEGIDKNIENLDNQEQQNIKKCGYTILAGGTNNQLLALDYNGEIKQNTYENIVSYAFANEKTGSYCYLEQNGNLYYVTKDREEPQLIDQNVQNMKNYSYTVSTSYKDAIDRIFYQKNDGTVFFWSQKFGSIKIEHKTSLPIYSHDSTSSFSANYVAFVGEEVYIVSIENKTEEPTGLEDVDLIAIDDTGVLIYKDSEDGIYSYSNGTITLLGSQESISGIDIQKQTYLNLDEASELKEINYVDGTELSIEQEVVQYWVIDPFDNKAVYPSPYYNDCYKKSEEYVIRKQDGNCYYKNGADGSLTLLFDCNGYEVSDIKFNGRKEKLYYTIYDSMYDTKSKSLNDSDTTSLYYSYYSNGLWSERELVEHSIEKYNVLKNGNIVYLQGGCLKYWNGENISVLIQEVQGVGDIIFSNSFVYSDGYMIQCMNLEDNLIQAITGDVASEAYNAIVIDNMAYCMKNNKELYQIDIKSQKKEIVLENYDNLILCFWELEEQV